MAIDPEVHIRRVAEFQDDLRRLDPLKVIRKHITTGPSAVLPEPTYYELRDEVADHFNLHPSEVIVVGSCRTGFSLKPNKRYQPFSDSSDIDIAIISQDRFDAYWDLVFHHWRSTPLWARLYFP